MKTLLRSMLGALVVVAILSHSGAAAEPTPAATYEEMLYDLGAFPVAKLTIHYWTNGNPGQVYDKGDRVDVDGWLPPAEAPSYLTEAEKSQNGIPKKPLRYEQYMAMLDIDAYRRTRDPRLFLVMRFALAGMATSGVPISKADILRVYEARVGLEPFTIALLQGQLSSADAMRLLNAYRDEKLFGILPAPKPADTAYLVFLAAQADDAKWPIRCRQDAHRLLLAVDENTYRNPYREFLLGNAKTAKDWWDRVELYHGLICMNDEECWKAVREGLLDDPITDCREAILYHLEEHAEVASVIDTILLLAKGRYKRHHPVTVSRMSGQWSYKLNRYLEWAKTQDGLDAQTRQKVDKAIAKLRGKEWD